MPGQFGFHRLILPQMRPHQALPKPAVAWHKEMQQLMDDHIAPVVDCIKARLFAAALK